MYDYCRVIKKRKRKKRLLILSAVVLLAAVLAGAHYNFYVIPTIRKIAEEEVRILATSSVGKAAAETVTDTYSYHDLVEVTSDSDGNIVLLQANSTFIHVLVRTAATRAQTYLGEITEANVRVPLGTVSGITFFSGRGPDILIKVMPIGSVSTQVETEFVSVGINQTLHRIYVRLRADVTVIMPGFEGKVSSSVHIPITESVLVGKVPDFYLNSPAFDKVLNLMP